MLVRPLCQRDLENRPTKENCKRDLLSDFSNDFGVYDATATSRNVCHAYDASAMCEGGGVCERERQRDQKEGVTIRYVWHAYDTSAMCVCV